MERRRQIGKTVGRVLRERGIATTGSVGASLVRITDPDGIGIELTAMGS
jgi:hypothetical protein